MISRWLTDRLVHSLKTRPVVALLGPRQVGKTTLAYTVSRQHLHKPIAYLDLETDSDMAKLTDAEGYLKRFENQLLVIDEVQNAPDLFRILRNIVDGRKRAGERSGQFLLLGSASRELLQSSSETLAGRIRYLELSPFNVPEISAIDPLMFRPDKLWLRGGFPDSYLAGSEEDSWDWRTDFIKTYLERDIPKFGLNIAATKLQRFWTMLAHVNGQQLNFSSLAKSLEVTHPTIRAYLDLLTDLYMIRQLTPWAGNSKKRLVKSPKMYVRDTGILHRLLGISSFENLLGHPIVGSSWEGFVIENILEVFPDSWTPSYYRSSTGAEIDLVLEGHGECWAIEIKRSIAPKLKASFHNAAEDINATRKWVIYSGQDRFPLSNGVEVIGLVQFLQLALDRVWEAKNHVY